MSSWFLSVAVVGLERTFFEVSENVGVVELCAVVYQPVNIECPIAFPFDVCLTTREDTTGKRDFYVIAWTIITIVAL